MKTEREGCVSPEHGWPADCSPMPLLTHATSQSPRPRLRLPQPPYSSLTKTTAALPPRSLTRTWLARSAARACVTRKLVGPCHTYRARPGSRRRRLQQGAQREIATSAAVACQRCVPATEAYRGRGQTRCPRLTTRPWSAHAPPVAVRAAAGPAWAAPRQPAASSRARPKHGHQVGWLGPQNTHFALRTLPKSTVRSAANASSAATAALSARTASRPSWSIKLKLRSWIALAHRQTRHAASGRQGGRRCQGWGAADEGPTTYCSLRTHHCACASVRVMWRSRTPDLSSTCACARHPASDPCGSQRASPSCIRPPPRPTARVHQRRSRRAARPGLRGPRRRA